MHGFKSRSWILPLLLHFATTRGSAGIGVDRAGDPTVAVPITSLNAVELDRPVVQMVDELLRRVPTTPQPSDLAILRKYSPFSALPNDKAVTDRFQTIPSVVLRGIQAIRMEDSEAGAALAYLANNRRISLAFGGLPGADMEVRDDGSARYGNEALNIYWVPQLQPGQTSVRLYDPDGLRLLNGLAKAGQYMVLPGYTGRPPQTGNEYATWALSSQLRSITVGSNAVERLLRMSETFEGIAGSLEMPESSDGMARRVGRQLLNDASMTSDQKRSQARLLVSEIQGYLLPREKLQLDARSFYRQSLDLTISGRLPSLNGYNEPFKRSGYFVESVFRPGTPHPYTSYYGGYASIDKPTTTPTLKWNNQFWRVSGKADGTRETETFTLNELGGISFGAFEGKRFLVGGPTPDFSQFRFIGFQDADGDGRIEAATKQTLFTTDAFLGGASFSTNPTGGASLILDRGTRQIFQLQGSGPDAFPNGVKAVGSLGNERMDAWRLNLSYDGKWAYGFTDVAGTQSRYDHHVESYYNVDLKQFQPLRLGYTFEESRLNAAAAGPVRKVDQAFRFSGSSDTEYRVYIKDSNMWTERASATTDPYGNGLIYIPDADTTLKVGGYLRFSRPDGTEASPDYPISTNPVAPVFTPPRLRGGDRLSLEVNYQPDSELSIQRSTSFNNYETVESRTTNPFGIGYFSDCLPDPPASFYSWRAIAVAQAISPLADYYLLAPGVRHTLYPAWNDTLYGKATFALDPAVGPALGLMLAVTMDPRTSAFLGAVATFSENPLTYRVFQDAVFIAARQTVVIPDLKRLFNPRVQFSADGNYWVSVRCLVLDGKHYPMMQFRLAYADHCKDTHWHGNRVYGLENDNTGRIDPDPNNCGFGAFLEVKQEEVPIPFLLWMAYRRLVLGPPAAAATPLRPFVEPVCATAPE